MAKTEQRTDFRAHFLSLAWSKLRLCSANHRSGYWSNLPCDWPSSAGAYSELRLCSADHRPGYWSNLSCEWPSSVGAYSELRLCSADHRPGYWSNLPCDWPSSAGAYSELRLCSADHRPGYWSNLPCDWPSTAWAYSEQGDRKRAQFSAGNPYLATRVALWDIHCNLLKKWSCYNERFVCSIVCSSCLLFVY